MPGASRSGVAFRGLRPASLRPVGQARQGNVIGGVTARGGAVAAVPEDDRQIPARCATKEKRHGRDWIGWLFMRELSSGPRPT